MTLQNSVMLFKMNLWHYVLISALGRLHAVLCSVWVTLSRSCSEVMVRYFNRVEYLIYPRGEVWCFPSETQMCVDVGSGCSISERSVSPEQVRVGASLKGSLPMWSPCQLQDPDSQISRDRSLIHWAAHHPQWIQPGIPCKMLLCGKLYVSVSKYWQF